VPALEKGMALNLAEIDDIANNPEPANFQNTIIALEKAGSDLNRVFRYWGIWSSNKNSPEFRDIQKEMVPSIKKSLVYKHESIHNEVRQSI
jgi:peptidyl-dipeptidase Dcp